MLHSVQFVAQHKLVVDNFIIMTILPVPIGSLGQAGVLLCWPATAVAVSLL